MQCIDWRKRMYRCDTCGNDFEEPAKWTEERSGDGWAHETVTASPCCGTGYYELHPCHWCGEVAVDEYTDYCDVCTKNMQIELEDIAYRAGKTFDELLEFISEVYDV